MKIIFGAALVFILILSSLFFLVYQLKDIPSPLTVTIPSPAIKIIGVLEVGKPLKISMTCPVIAKPGIYPASSYQAEIILPDDAFVLIGSNLKQTWETRPTKQTKILEATVKAVAPIYCYVYGIVTITVLDTSSKSFHNLGLQTSNFLTIRIK